MKAVKEVVRLAKHHHLWLVEDCCDALGSTYAGQPYMQGRLYRVAGTLANTDRVMHDTFWIGLWPGLTEEMLDFAVARISEFFGQGI